MFVECVVSLLNLIHRLTTESVRMFYSSEDWEIYYTKWFDKLIKWPFPRLAMHIWTAWMLARYGLGFLMKRAWRRVKGLAN